MKKQTTTIEEKIEILKTDEELKQLKENAKIAQNSEQKENLRNVRSKIEWRIREILKPKYLWFHTADWLITIGFAQENGKVRYSYLDQNQLELKSEPIYSCQTQFNRWYALVQDPETLIWSVIDKDLNKVDTISDYNWNPFWDWESEDFFKLRIKLSNLLSCKI